MTTETRANAARRYLTEYWNDGDADALAEILAPDAVGHVAGMTFSASSEALFARRAKLLAIYTDPSFTLEDEIACGDKIVLRWAFRGRHTGAGAGVAPTGREVAATGINIFRLADGRIAELWVESDDLGEQRQLGLIAA